MKVQTKGGRPFIESTIFRYLTLHLVNRAAVKFNSGMKFETSLGVRWLTNISLDEFSRSGFLMYLKVHVYKTW